MKINNDVLTVLSNSEISGNTLKLTGQLDRKLYVKTNEVLEAAGGKWNRKAKAHIFPDDATEIIEQIILTGEITKPQDFGYFPTPEPIVEQLIGLANVKTGMSVLEPSAGQGNIAKEIAKITNVDCVELLPENVKKLDELELPGDVFVSNFLNLKPFQVYDRIVMNPPFAKQDDIRHVTHALKFLKPNGKLVSVMSASVVFRTNKLTCEFRDLVLDRDGEIIPLPEGSFKQSGTGVNTVIVVIPGKEVN